MAIITVTPELKSIFTAIYKNINKNPVAIYFYNIDNTNFNGDNTWSEYILDISKDEYGVLVSKVPSEEIIALKQKYIDGYSSSVENIRKRLTKIDYYRISRITSLFGKSFGNADIEAFINNYRGMYVDIISKAFEFKIVSGEDIRYWYNQARYFDGSGSLNKSCMRHEYERLDIYALNPDKVKMLILINRDNKLMGRCLLWKLDYPYGKIYSDRIYTVFAENEALFKNYIMKKKWWYRDKHKKNGKVVILNNASNTRLPHLDSFDDKRKKKTLILYNNVSNPEYKTKLSFYNRLKNKIFGTKEQTFEKMKTFEQFTYKK